MTTTNKNNYLILDLIRGIAALLVFLGHSRTIMFSEVNANENGILYKIFYFFTGFGHQSVIIFFVLSGFFIAKTINSDIEKKTWEFKRYFFNRLARLWVVLIPALIIGGLFDYFGNYFFSQEMVYTGNIPFLIDISPIKNMSLPIFFGNIFFLQNIVVTTWGSNGPLWSLTNEFWYYLMYPLLVILFLKNSKFNLRILSLILIGLIGVLVGKEILLYFSIWLIGVLAFYLKRSKKYGAILNFLTVALIFVTLFLIRIKYLPVIFNDFTLGGVTGFFVWSFSQYYDFGKKVNKVIEFFSNISYTLYLVHLPFCFFIFTVLNCVQIEFSILNLIKWILLVASVIIYAYLFWYFFERNTNKIKKYFAKLFA